jgi:hypothetical protein
MLTIKTLGNFSRNLRGKTGIKVLILDKTKRFHGTGHSVGHCPVEQRKKSVGVPG